MALTAADLLAELGIAARSTAPGRYYTLCPRCSHTRKPAHRKLRCLGVTIDADGIRFGCNHCDFKGGRFYAEAQRPASTKAPRTKGRSRRSFKTVYG